MVITSFRPFTKKWMYFEDAIIHRPRQYKKISDFGTIIFTTGTGVSKDFSALTTANIPNYHYLDTGRALYEKETNSIGDLSNISTFSTQYYNLNEEDTFYYVYGVLHSNEYKMLYSSDLNKAMARIPLLKNKEQYVDIGRKLIQLHLNYENQKKWENVEVQIHENEPDYRVKKMKHPKKGDLETIIYNDCITIKNIPIEAYGYIVNGRSAIEWIIDQYRVKTDKKSGIIDDPNEFSDDPKYILNLLLSIITVSMKTLELIEELPEFEVID